MIIERITSYRIVPAVFALAIALAMIVALYTHSFDGLVTP